MTESIYKSIEKAKNGTEIPVFKSGKTMESRYNPERDAENLCNTIETDSRFFLVLGIGSGLFIQKLITKYPDSYIIALENSQADIDFIKELPHVKELLKLTNVRFTDLSSLSNILINTFIPAKYGDLKIVEQRAWLLENQNLLEKIKSEINHAIGIVSADYSVQAHFGKIWQKNIMENAFIAAKSHNPNYSLPEKEIKKTAVIFAAGPSLEMHINDYLDKEKYFLISTDTAFSIFKKIKKAPDIVISIDGQNISYNHFLHNVKDHEKNSTQFYFDLCANSSIAKKIYEKGASVRFFCSGHPLASAINNSSNKALPVLFSGAGTVTISALDFALQEGFRNIIILGADFGFINGKAYAYGTYLENLYNINSSRFQTSETSFNKLMFRTPLKKNHDKLSTDVLEAYQYSLEKYLESKNINFIHKDNQYFIENNEGPSISSKSLAQINLKNFFKTFKSSSIEEAELLLLPYLAWLKNNPLYKNKKYDELLKLAFNSIVSYNI